LDIDFGYAYASGSYGISGITFHDNNADGATNPHPDTISDTVYAKVLVYLWMRDSGGTFTFIDSMWSNSSGVYSFTNLAAGTYKVSTSPTAPDGERITTNSIITQIGQPGIDLNETNPSSTGNDFGFVGPGRPTSVKLASFSARNRVDASPLLEWETWEEMHNLGFNLYRTDSPKELPGPEQRLNDGLIPSQALGSVTGATYAYVDETAVTGVTYYYWLEAIDDKGVTELYGPVSAVDVDTTTPSDIDTTTPLSSSTYLPIVIK
jgi:hypothetical protein